MIEDLVMNLDIETMSPNIEKRNVVTAGKVDCDTRNFDFRKDSGGRTSIAGIAMDHFATLDLRGGMPGGAQATYRKQDEKDLLEGLTTLLVNF